jgi:hypothetical protein
VQEATVWVDGLDRIHRHRGINFVGVQRCWAARSRMKAAI